MNLYFDCVIAGTGPAACACALVLKKAGFKVALVAKKSNKHPSFSVGESLPGAALPLLNRIGITDLAKLLTKTQFSRCTGNASAWGTELWHKTDAIQNPQGGGWHIDRAAFNHALLELAVSQDVTLLCSQILSAEYQSSWQLTLKAQTDLLRCAYLIDGTGRASSLGKLIGRKKIHLDKQMAIVAWFESSEDDQEKMTRIKAVSDGWWYSARLPNKSAKGSPIRVVAKFMLPEQSKALNTPQAYLRQLNKSGLLPVEFNAPQMLSGPYFTDASVSKLDEFSNNTLPFLAIGDAALSLDPLSSQGMFFALYSGIKAGEQIIEAKTNQINQFANYDKDINAVLSANQKARKHYYVSEHRFAESEYWQSRVLQ